MLLGVALLIVVPLKSLRVCCSAVLTVSGLLCVDYFLRRVSVTWVMATDSAATTGGRAGIAFDVELVVPWDAPEAAVDLHSNGVVELDTVPDVLGLTGRRPGATVVRVLQGRDVRALVPDPRVLERDFHDATIVDMGDLPEPSVSMDELSLLRRQWPATVLRNMVWLRQDLDTMRAEVKKRFRNTRPGDCYYCGKWIKCIAMWVHITWT